MGAILEGDPLRAFARERASGASGGLPVFKMAKEMMNITPWWRWERWPKKAFRKV